LDLGFIDFLNLIKKDPERKRVFEELPYKEGLYSRNISRNWNASYLPKIDIKTNKNGFHSLRHSVIDNLKQIGVEPHFINELVGHSQGNIDLDRYGKRYNPDILYNKCVKRIVYETSNARRIDFLALKLDWKLIIG
jgi:integrase